MRLFSYILTHDNGFAPNPFFSVCTLATCKPRIRSAAQKGDWIAGFGSVSTVGAGKLVYAMQVTDVLTFDDYNRDPRFHRKKPRLNGTALERHGDNIYYRDDAGQWRQRNNPHHSLKHLTRDVERGRHVLVGRPFFYLGADAKRIPARFSDLVPVTQGHRSRFPETLVEDFLDWLQRTSQPGRHGTPFGWSGQDDGVCCPIQAADRR